MEKADERIISLEAEIRIIREEKKRAEEECQKLRDENYIFRDRLAEIANSHPSPTTSAYLTNEIEALANRVEELTSELGAFSKYLTGVRLSESFDPHGPCGMGQYRVNDHPYYAPQFILDKLFFE